MPARLRASGGARTGRGPFRFTWQGGTVLQAINAATQRGMEAEAQEIRSDLAISIHKVSGEMAAKSFADVEIRSGRRTLVAGSDADHAVYEESGHIVHAARGDYFWPGHHVIRTVMDRHIPHIPPRIREALGGGGR